MTFKPKTNIFHINIGVLCEHSHEILLNLSNSARVYVCMLFNASKLIPLYPAKRTYRITSAPWTHSIQKIKAREKSHNSVEREQWKTYHLITGKRVWLAFWWTHGNASHCTPRNGAHQSERGKQTRQFYLSTWFLNYYNSSAQWITYSLGRFLLLRA